MKSISVVVLVAILAISAQAECPDEYCTNTILVTQDFASNDCSGNYTVRPSHNYTEACTVSTSPYLAAIGSQCSANDGYTSFATLNSNTCSLSKAYAVANVATGVCTSDASGSSITWCNKASISTNFKPVKAPTNEPLFHPSTPDQACNITHGCPERTGSSTTYSDATCANAINIVPASDLFVNGSLLLDKCYTTNATSSAISLNVKATCGNGKYTITYTTGGCGSSSNKVLSYAYSAEACLPDYAGTWFTIRCPSAASALVTGLPLALFLLFIAFLLI